MIFNAVRSFKERHSKRGYKRARTHPHKLKKKHTLRARIKRIKAVGMCDNGVSTHTANASIRMYGYHSVSSSRVVLCVSNDSFVFQLITEQSTNKRNIQVPSLSKQNPYSLWHLILLSSLATCFTIKMLRGLSISNDQ